MAVFLAVTVLVAVAADRPGADATSPSEMGRLRNHFSVVLRELRQADVSRLSAAQMAARSEMIARLERYAAAGRFPHNHMVAGRRVPVFREEHQTLCAKGFLIASTGRADIVDDVARTANLERIPELAGDERLRAWLDSAGLTVREAARIQPSYGGCGSFGCVDPEPTQPTTHTERRATAAYYIGSSALGALNGASTALNLMSVSSTPTRARRVASFGFVAGTTHVVLGAFVLDQPAAARSVGIANMVLGSVTVGSSVWRLKHLPRESAVARVSTAPYLSGTRSMGLALAARM